MSRPAVLVVPQTLESGLRSTRLAVRALCTDGGTRWFGASRSELTDVPAGEHPEATAEQAEDFWAVWNDEPFQRSRPETLAEIAEERLDERRRNAAKSRRTAERAALYCSSGCGSAHAPHVVDGDRYCRSCAFALASFVASEVA
jgi:hypothetical protein